MDRNKVAIYYPHLDSPGFSFLNLWVLMTFLHEYFLDSLEVKAFQPECAGDPEIEKFRELQADCDTVILVMDGNEATYELGCARRSTEYERKTKILFAITDPFIKLPAGNFGLGGDEFDVFEWYRWKDNPDQFREEARKFLLARVYGLPVPA